MRIRIRLPIISIDSLLLAAIIGLSVVLFWPAVEAWQNRPRPGVQASHQYVPPKDGGMPIDYLIYLPREYEPSRKWPLVIFLHGSGARGQDLQLVRREGLARLVDLGEQFDFILVSPQCATNSTWAPEKIVELTEHVSNSFSVDRDRVYLTGNSMGGYGTWAAASFAPGRFAAIVPLCGGGDAAQARRLVNLPIWAFHGASDDVVPLEASEAMVDAVKKCGGSVQFTMYPERGHDICDVTYRDKRLYKWLLAQRRSQQPIASVEGTEDQHK